MSRKHSILPGLHFLRSVLQPSFYMNFKGKKHQQTTSCSVHLLSSSSSPCWPAITLSHSLSCSRASQSSDMGGGGGGVALKSQCEAFDIRTLSARPKANGKIVLRGVGFELNVWF